LTGTVYLFTLGCIGFGWLADSFFVDDMIDLRNDFNRTPIGFSIFHNKHSRMLTKSNTIEFSLKEKAIKKRDMKIAYFLLMIFGVIGLHRWVYHDLHTYNRLNQFETSFYLGGDATYTATIVAMCATLVSTSWGVFVVLQGQSNFVPLLFLGLFGLVDLGYYLYDFIRYHLYTITTCRPYSPILKNQDSGRAVQCWNRFESFRWRKTTVETDSRTLVDPLLR